MFLFECSPENVLNLHAKVITQITGENASFSPTSFCLAEGILQKLMYFKADVS